MNLGRRAVGLVLLLVLPWAEAHGRARESVREQDACGQDEEIEIPEETMASMRVAVSGQPRPITGVRLHGLKALTEERVWQLIGPRPEGEIPPEHAALLLARLSTSGLFASVTPTLDVVGDAAVLDVALVEHPVVSRIRIEGLTEVRAEELLEAILDGAPLARAGKCAPPESWLAHASQEGLAPGIVWQGLRGALDRALEKLLDRGYAMASIEGELATDGTLTLHADEGHLEALELQGVEPTVEPEVRKLLGLKPGDLFLMDDLRQGVKRVRRTLPFLEPASGDDDDDGRRPMPRIAEERLENGRVRYRTVEGGSRKLRKFPGQVEISGRTLSWSFGEENEGTVTLPFPLWTDQPRYVAIQGKRATVRLRPQLTDVDWDWKELLHHTQVQGYAPGLLLSVTLQDPENRGHLTLDGGLWLNTARPQERIDYLVGARLRVPWLRVAEVGAQRYSLTDTQDDWRATPLSSYLGSGLLNRPDREYYRRDGFTGLLTLHLGDRLTAGAEYRNDAERSMESAATSQSLFNRGEAPWINSPIDEGRVVSLVGRLEYSSEPALLRNVGAPLRSLQRGLARPDWDEDDDSGWRTVNTVEVADPRLGSDLRFTRLQSDTSLRLRTGGGGGLRGRLRVAGGVGLPAQRQEALGGWTALRGYDFKELRGDASALVSAEYRWTVFSAFVDVGSVRDAGVWSRAKVGVGAAFNLGDLSLAAAWRTDERARAAPEFRMVFQRTY